MGSPPTPRLCHIVKWGNFEGYGFNLLAEKSRPGQFIGKIDPDSPAEVAGLKEGDRIVEVNGVNVNQENHKQVVQRIKSVDNETTLLVVDKECDQYHKDHGIIVKSSLPYVIHKSSKMGKDEKIQEEMTHPPITQDLKQEVNENFQDIDQDEKNDITELGTEIQYNHKAPGSLSSGSNRSSPDPHQSPVSGKSNSSITSDSEREENSLTQELNLNMSALEMREKINSWKRRDPRREKSGVSIAKKFEMIQAL